MSADNKHMKATPEGCLSVPLAKFVTVAVCEHGIFHLCLHDDDGEIFAAGLMDLDGAAGLSEDITAHCQDYLDKKLRVMACEGSA